MKKFICSILFVSILSISPLEIYADNLDYIDLIINKVNLNYDIPEISGQVDNMPWRNNIDFLNAKEKYNTPRLIAGFCAVLKDPLPGEEYNVNFASEKLRGQVIKSGEIFSQNISIGPYTKLKGFKDGASYSAGKIVMTEGGGVCKIATSLYNLAVLSNLEIVERHNHSMPVNYVPLGQDATVAYGIKDFKFRNTTDNPIFIWSEMIGNRLYMGFYGMEKPPKIKWSHEISNITEFSTQYIKNEKLAPGEMKVFKEGQNGSLVKSTIKIVYGDNHYEIKNMGISHYNPLPKLVEVN